MSSLVALLSDLLALSLPGPPELELAGPGAPLALARERAPALGTPSLGQMLARCAGGELAAYEELAALLAPLGPGAPDLGELAAGLVQLLALRAALLARPRVGGRLRLSAPGAFAALRRLRLPHTSRQPPTLLIGRLGTEPPLLIERPAGVHKVTAYMRLSFDDQAASPLLDIDVDSQGPQVPFQGERKRWRQPLGQVGELQVHRRDNYCHIDTYQLDAPITLDAGGLLIEVRPASPTRLYRTQLRDERKRVVASYLRAY